MATIDEQAVLRSWAESAERIGEAVLASDLLEAAGGGPDDDLDRARAAVLAGRPALAAGLLADVGRSVLTADEHTWRDVVALAAWAAQGDAEAMGLLIRLGQPMDGRAAVVYLSLLAAAAEQAGQHDIADGAWQDLVDRTGAAPTPVVRRRLVATDLLRRSTTDARAAGGVVGAAARTLVDMSPPPETSAGHVEDVVRRLEHRGDRAGARLLLEAVVRLRPAASGVEQLRASLPGAQPWWRVHLPGLALALAATAFVAVSSIMALPAWWPCLAVLAVVGLDHELRRPRVAGLSAVDAKTLEEIRAITPDGARGGSFTGLRKTFVGACAGATALIFGTIAAAVVEDGPAARFATANPAGFYALAFPLLTVAVLLAAVGGARLTARMMRRESQAYVAVRHDEAVAAVRGCHCLRLRAVRGAEADAYVAGHLRRADRAVAALVPRGTPSALEARQCPASSIPWLSVTAPGRERLLVRGTYATVAPATGPTETGYL